MIELATVLYLSYALYRRDWGLYEFDEPIVLYTEPKDEFVMVLSADGWGLKHGNEYTTWFGSDGNAFIKYADASIT